MRGEITWRAHKSITALPPGFWNEKVAKDDISRYEQFLRILESESRDSTFVCFVAYLGEAPAGCAYFNVRTSGLAGIFASRWSLAIGNLRKALRGQINRRRVVAGVLSVDGENWWHDPQVWSWEEFLTELYGQILGHWRSVHQIVLRSYVLRDGPLSEEIRLPYRRLGFVEQDELLNGDLMLDPLMTTGEAFLASLGSKKRAAVRRMLRKREEYGLQYQHSRDMASLVDEIYPLYLATVSRSTDLAPADVLTKRVFERVANEPTLRPCIQMVRDRDGKLIAFGANLESETTLFCWLMGMDYSVNRDYALVYHVYWLAILQAIEDKRRHVNLSATNDFVKERFGAVLNPNKQFAISPGGK